MGSSEDDGIGRKCAVSGEAAQAAGAEAEPNPPTPANIRTAVGEEFEQYAKQEGADHVDAERGNRYARHPGRQRGDQVTEPGTSATTDGNESDARPRQGCRSGGVGG